MGAAVKAYLSTGHGRRADGSYDSGTTTGGVHEHEQARRVVQMAAQRLRARGAEVVADKCPDGRYEHSPNYHGSAKRANRKAPDVAVEVHWDWIKAPRGGFGIYGDREGRRLSGAIARRYRQAGMALRSHQRRRLYFVRKTNMPAILWECDRIGDYPSSHLREIAHCIADGIADHFGMIGLEEEDVLKRDDEGNEVHWLQWRLNEYLHGNREAKNGITVDGAFGPETEEAVREVQRRFAFEPTGVVDLSTYTRLIWQLLRS